MNNYDIGKKLYLVKYSNDNNKLYKIYKYISILVLDYDGTYNEEEVEAN